MLRHFSFPDVNVMCGLQKCNVRIKGRTDTLVPRGLQSLPERVNGAYGAEGIATPKGTEGRTALIEWEQGGGKETGSCALLSIIGYAKGNDDK